MYDVTVKMTTIITQVLFITFGCNRFVTKAFFCMRSSTFTLYLLLFVCLFVFFTSERRIKW